MRFLKVLLVIVVILGGGAYYALSHPNVLLPVAVRAAGTTVAKQWMASHPLGLQGAGSLHPAVPVAIAGSIPASEMATAEAVGKTVAANVPAHVTISASALTAIPPVLRGTAQKFVGTSVNVSQVDVVNVSGSSQSGNAAVIVTATANGVTYHLSATVTLSQDAIVGVQSMSLSSP